MEEIKDLILVLKKEEFSKYDLEFNYYIPTAKDQFKDYAILSDSQRRIFRLFLRDDPKALSRLDFKFLPKKIFSNISEDEFEKAIQFFSNTISSEVDLNICATIHLPADKYATIPSLPTIFDKENVHFGTPLLTGVKVSFENAKKDLIMVGLDVTPCLACGVIDLRIILILKKKCNFSAKVIISALSEIEEYSKFFYKSRNGK